MLLKNKSLKATKNGISKTIYSIKLYVALSSIVCLGTLSILSPSCASMGSPSGGARDTLAPEVVKIWPENLSTSFKEKSIELRFNEYIQLKDPKKQIFLSPPAGNIESKLKGKSLVINLPDSLREATTYTLNFGNALSDLNEGNVQNAFKYVFSTGTFLDSLILEGFLFDAVTHKPLSGKPVIAWFYSKNNTDSIPFKDPPAYYAISNDDGGFIIENMKAGTYLLFALDDLNGNFRLDLPKESYAFYSDTVQAGHALPLSLRQSANPGPPRFRSAAHSAYNKIDFSFYSETDSVYIRPLQPQLLEGFYHWNVKRDSLQLFFDTNLPDSLLFEIRINQHIDTARFLKRNYDSLSLSILLSNTTLHPGDSLYVLSKRPFKANSNAEVFWLITETDTQKLFLGNANRLAMRHALPLVYNKSQTGNFKVLFEPGFWSGLGLSHADTIALNFSTQNLESYAEFNLKVTPNWPGPFLVELLNASGKVVHRSAFNKTFQHHFKTIEAGKYSLRLLHDVDANQRYSPGDWLLKRQPETWYYYDEDILLKGNWEIDLNWLVEEGKTGGNQTAQKP